MRKFILLVGVIVLLLSGVERKPSPKQVTFVPKSQPVLAAKVEGSPKPVVETWSITTSPHAKVPVERINGVLAHLQAKGMPKQSAAYLVGNFIAESYLEHDNCRGDGGTACGIAQWRFNRRVGMPVGLLEQVDWAIDFEMDRDASAGRYISLKAILFNETSTPAQLLQGFKNWERYGIEGNRGLYGQKIMESL